MISRGAASATTAVGGIVLAYWASPLSFVPVPWPDDSAFFLPGIDLVRWPPVYRMHAQAPFVPTYDQANFNTMPLLPLLLGAGNLFGLGSSHAIRVFGMAALGAWALLFMAWLRKRKVPEPWVWLATLAALLSPALRWGSMVVRTEAWQGLLWLLILLELDGFFERPSRWRLPAFLALAAYFHFEAIVWVVPTALGLAWAASAWRRALSAWWSVGWRTALLLGPWVLYVIWNWDLFWIQMETQFNRLAEPHHPWVPDLYGLFHHLFIPLGMPVGYPKFFNLGKGITWALLVAGFLFALRPKRYPVREKEAGTFLAAEIAAAAALLSTFYLWLTKPETWFTTLIHFSLWPLIGFLLPSPSRNAPATPAALRRAGLVSLGAALGVLLILEAGMAIQQAWRMAPHYSWEKYRRWVDCIDAAIGPRARIWQPHWPDVLVELAGRKPGRDYTRAVDFQNIEPLLRAHSERSEAIVHSLFLPIEEEVSRLRHRGVAREIDRFYLTDYPWIPFKEFSALRREGGWSLTVCQEGPLWAALSLKPVPGASP